MVISLAAAGPLGLCFGIGPAIGGAANLWIGTAWKNKAQRTAGDTKVSEPVWKFIHGLAQHVLGPSYPFRAANLGYYPVSTSWNGWRQVPRLSASSHSSTVATTGPKSAREVLHPQVFELMDEAATQFNRVHGYLSHPAAATIRDGFRIQIAADQAMVDAVSIGCTMQQFPENIESMRPSVTACIQALKEAADLVASIVATEAPAVVHQEQAVLLRGMLDDLRIESQARTELNQPDPPRLEQRG